MIRTEHSLWTEKYRPATLDTYIGNETVINKVKTFIETNDVPNLLFHGRAGGGKTTLAKIIVNSINCDYLYINASDERNIDLVRDKIKNFASSAGFNPLKVVLLDECLHEDTLVTILREGEETQCEIKALDQKNDLVKSFNIDTGKIEWQPFILLNKGNQNIWEIELENGELVKCTADHKWFVLDTNSNIQVVKTIELSKYNHILSPA